MVSLDDLDAEDNLQENVFLQIARIQAVEGFKGLQQLFEQGPETQVTDASF